MGVTEMIRIAELVDRSLAATGEEAVAGVRAEVLALAAEFPLYASAGTPVG
jgi:glycine/serine hydroxymethyltransferase